MEFGCWATPSATISETRIWLRVRVPVWSVATTETLPSVSEARGFLTMALRFARRRCPERS